MPCLYLAERENICDYDQTMGMVIRARDEDHARLIIIQSTQGETNGDVWKITKLHSMGPTGLILKSFRHG